MSGVLCRYIEYIQISTLTLHTLKNIEKISWSVMQSRHDPNKMSLFGMGETTAVRSRQRRIIKLFFIKTILMNF